MKRKAFRTLSVLLAALMLLSAAACSLKETTEEEETEDNSDEIAVSIGDDYTITKGEIEDEYNYYVQMYSYYGLTTPSTDEDIEEMQDQIVSMLVSPKLELYYADQMGVTLTDEMKEEAEANAESDMSSYMESFVSEAESEGAEDTESRALEIFQEQLDAAEMDMDVEGFRAYLIEQYENQARITALEDKIIAETEVTDEDVQTYYDDLLDTQQETYDATPADYLTDEEDYEMSGGDPIVYVPEGYIRVRSIVISPDAELSDEYETLKSDMDTLEAEYGKAALEALAEQAAAATDAAATSELTLSDVENGAEILSEYIEKKTQTDAMYEEYIKDARAKADEAYASLESGTAFTDVLNEYGEDDTYTTYPSFVDTGLLMLREGDTTWDEALVTAALQFKDGEHTGVIQVGDAFYILELVGDEPAGARALADVYDEISAIVQSQNGEETISAKLEELENDTTITTYYEDVYRDIGK